MRRLLVNVYERRSYPLFSPIGVHIKIYVCNLQGNPNGGLANGGLARKSPIGPKRALSGQFLLFPRGCGVRKNWSRSALKRPRSALKRPQWEEGPPEITRADFECRFPCDSYGTSRAPFRPFLGERFGGNIRRPLLLPAPFFYCWLKPRLWAPVWIFPKSFLAGVCPLDGPRTAKKPKSSKTSKTSNSRRARSLRTRPHKRVTMIMAGFCTAEATPSRSNTLGEELFRMKEHMGGSGSLSPNFSEITASERV